MTNKNLTPQTKTDDGNSFVISYLLMRQLIGVLGILLPILLIAGKFFLNKTNPFQPSISHYYYSEVHIVFIGTLCLLAGFLGSYRGKSKLENKVSNVAGFFAFCVATFPTNLDGYIGKNYVEIPKSPNWFQYIHFGSAFILFISFAIFCIKIFQNSDEDIIPQNFDLKKKRRNNFYKICGYGIIASIVCIGATALYHNFGGKAPLTFVTFIFETTALLCFGSSWLLKGSLNWPKSDNGILRTTIRFFR